MDYSITAIRIASVFAVLALGASNVFGQDHTIEQDINLAKTLKAKYGDKTDVACISSTTTVTFKYTTSKNAISPVTATENIDEKLIALKDNATFERALYYDQQEDVGDIQAYGKNNRPSDVYAQDVSVGSDDIFYSGEHCKAFALPFGSMGQILRYTAQRYCFDLKYFDRLIVAEYYPYEKKTIVFDVPKWLSVDFKEENFDGYAITKSVTEDPKTHNTLYTFTATNIGAYNTKEEDTPNELSVLPHILILTKSFNTPSGATVNVLGTMDQLYSFTEGLVKTAGNKDDAIKPIVAKLIADKKTDVDKIKAIYYWVEDNIRYIAFENGISAFKPSPCQDVYNNKYGDCKGMANLLTIMLKDAGFDARRTWIGVDGIPYDFTTPTLCLFNHCICTLIYNGKHYYLDGVEKYAPFGDNSDWIQGKNVMIEDGDKFIAEKIPVEAVDLSKVDIHQDITVDGQSMIVGKETTTYTGDNKSGLLDEYNMAPNNEKSAAMKQLAQHNNKNIEVKNVTTSDLSNREIPLKISSDLTIKDQVNAFDNDMYVNIDDRKWFQYLTIDTTRYFDYSFRFRKDYSQTVNFTVPAGYKVKHLPDPVNVATDNYTFKISISQQGNVITYKKDFEVLNPIIKKKDFKKWNADLAVVKKTYDDQLVLTK